MYDDWRPTIEHLPDIGEYLPTQEMSIPFARRVVSSGNIFPTSNEVTYEQLHLFQGVLQNSNFFVLIVIELRY